MHATAPVERPLGQQEAATLEQVGLKAGDRIGVIRAFARSESQAASDSLTGLLNRRSLEEQVHGLLRAGSPYAVVYADLDHFKRLNDTHGHESGDRALRLFTRTLRATARQHDLIARWGGEEFLVVVPQASAEQAAGLAERIREALTLALANGATPHFTASFGVSDSSQADELEVVGLDQASRTSTVQRQLDGTPYTCLPQVDPHLTSPPLPADRCSVAAGDAFDSHFRNKPFDIDRYVPADQKTIDLVHRYYQEQVQIDGGRMDRFTAVSDAKGLTQGHYHTDKLPLASLAREGTLADHFFHGAFGGSFLNHFWLVCACTPTFPGAPADMHTVVDPATGLPTAGHDKQLTPAGEDYVINTAFSVNSPHPATVPAAQLVPEQTAPTIGDRLSGAGVSWAWYAGGWDDAVAGHPPRCSSSTTSRSPTSPTTPTAPRAAPPTSRTRPTSSPPPRRAPCRPCPSSSRSARTTSTLATPTWRAASGTSSA